jgi:hypothetical protein
MFFSNTTFLGIDPTAGQRPFAYAAVDHDLRLLAIGQGNMDEVLAFVAGQRQALVAVCAPRRPNKGLLAREDVRLNLSPAPRPGRWLDFRMAEYLLRQHNITIPQTLAREEACPNWMQMGFSLHRRLEGLGYHPFPAEESSRQCLEVYPHACFAVLLEVIPFPKYSLEGRLQRQLALHEKNLNVPDPMRIFEEITRHRLLKGILPVENLYSPGELDALVAAFTAWMAATRPDEITLLGDPAEGQIVLPVAGLKARY